MTSDLQTTQETFIPPQTFSLDFHSARLTERQFQELCRNNPDLKFEMSARGELIIVPPTLPDSGWRNNDLSYQVTAWARKDKTGIVFDSSTIFTFPNGAKRSPDVSWMKREKWDNLTEAEREKVSKLVPDFVIELRSSTDALKTLQDKMAEYIENDVRLGWLIDPKNKKVHVYRVDGAVEILDNPETVAGEDVLAGFQLNVREIW